MLILKNLAFTVLVPGTVAVLVPQMIISYWSDRNIVVFSVFGFVGMLFIGAGIVIYFLCLREFIRARGTPAPMDAPKELVILGLYQYLRNPMYVGVLCLIVGQALTFHSLPVLIYAGIVFLMFHLTVVLYEEPKLSRTFGESYNDYRKKIPRWFGFRRHHGS
jgi:protein-S-isoprenylcysteine O-methyltransferase Ste14